MAETFALPPPFVPPLPEAVNVRPWDLGRPPSRILAIRLQAFGDMAITLPYLQALRRLLPDTRLDFLTRSEVAELPSSLVLFDKVCELGGGRNSRRQLASALAMAPRLWARRYEVVIDLQRNRVSRTVRRLLNPRAWSEFDRYSPMLAGERTRRAIEALGLGTLAVRPDLQLKASERGLSALRAAGWDTKSDLVVLNPAAAFAARNWPLAHYVEFCRLWMKRRPGPARFLLLGLPKIAGDARVLQEAIGEPAINLVGHLSASDVFAILQRVTLVLSEDSGLLHLGWVAGAPTLGLFGASPLAWTRPHGNYSASLSACCEGDGVCLNGICRAGSPPCLSRLDAGAVVQRALQLVDEAAGSPKCIPVVEMTRWGLGPTTHQGRGLKGSGLSSA